MIESRKSGLFRRVFDWRMVLIFLVCSAGAVGGKDRSENRNQPALSQGGVLEPQRFRYYIDSFNKYDRETIKNEIDNAHCWDWLSENIPLFECPDRDLEEIYYYRWWIYRKHIKKTPAGYIITEFLPPVSHAQQYNAIACAAGLHFEEGRWLRRSHYLEAYARFWFERGGKPRQYSCWIPHAIWRFCQVIGKDTLAVELLPRFVENFHRWEASNRHPSGLFWSYDNRDGGEHSISGSGLRPTLNAYMVADARAIARIAERAGNATLAEQFSRKAARFKQLIQERLWDTHENFFKTIPLKQKETPVDSWDFRLISGEHNVRELYGYIPWKFHIPDPGYESAWLQFKDEKGFRAPYGLTTAEQRHPRFMKYRIERCQWDGPVWPFTSCMTLKALANLLQDYRQDVMTKTDYFTALRTYARSQHKILPYGERIPWIGENLHPYSGIWLARALIWEKYSHIRDLNHGYERGKDYNHSSYCDLVISGLVGLRPDLGSQIRVHPLVPPDTWDWFCLDRVRYHGRDLTILYDKTGERYHRGRGFSLWCDGRLLTRTVELRPLSGTCPAVEEPNTREN